MADGGGGEGREMRLVARRDLEGGGFDLDEVAGREMPAQSSDDTVSREQGGRRSACRCGAHPGDGEPLTPVLPLAGAPIAGTGAGLLATRRRIG